MTLKEQLKAKLDARAALVKLAIDENRALTEDEQAQYTNLGKDISNLEATIKAADEQATISNTPVVEPIHATPKDANAKKWKNFSEYLNAVRHAATPGGAVDRRLVVMNAPSGLSESVQSDGGFLLEPEYSGTLLARTYEVAAVASKAFRVPISSGRTSLKMNAIDETSRANGSRYGGVQMYWENEADTVTASKPKFRQMSLELKKLMGLCYATDELLSDAAALEAIVTRAFTDEYAFKLDDALINGTGAGMPLGILNAACLISVTKETGQAADTIVFENVLKMWSRMWGRSRQNANWFINQDCEPQLYSMTLNVGTGGVPVYMPASGISGSPYGTLFGRPVIPIEQAATLGDAGDIILADMSQYAMIDRGGMEGMSSIHVRFIYDESVFRFIYRCDGQPMWNSALTPFKGSNTQSPFVSLAARA